LAKAFNRKLEYHQETIEKMKEYYSKKGIQLNEERLLMAYLPTVRKKKTQLFKGNQEILHRSNFEILT
jgi:molybdopterin-biosynthesis enzyme MoeA-like protein